MTKEQLEEKLHKMLDMFKEETEDLWEQFMEGIDPDPQKYDDFLDNAYNEATNNLKTLIYEVVKASVGEKKQLVEPVTKRPVKDGDKVGIDLDADTRGSLVFIQDNGFNQAIDFTLTKAKEMLGINNG